MKSLKHRYSKSLLTSSWEMLILNEVKKILVLAKTDYLIKWIKYIYKANSITRKWFGDLRKSSYELHSKVDKVLRHYTPTTESNGSYLEGARCSPRSDQMSSLGQMK